MESSDAAVLPAELIAEIVSIAAWEVAEVDKPWLAGITNTSQLILPTVKPILYHTVLLSAVNHDTIVGCAYSGNFSLTRNLWIDKAPAAPALVAAIFARVEHLSCTSGVYTTLRSVHAPFCPRMLSLRARVARDDAQLVRFVRDVTHLHLAIAPYAGPPAILAARPADMALRFAILEPTMPRWNMTQLAGALLPFFLACPALERVLLCAPAGSVFTGAAGREALGEYVAARGERRIWVLDAPTDGRQFRPGVTFDPLKWTRGRQLCAAPDGP